MSVAGWTMFVLFFLWSFLGMPIGYAMLASGIVYLMMTHQDLALVATQSLNGLYGSFVLLSVPLFILAAEIMNAGQLTEKMYGVANMLVGRYKGGLAHVNIVASVIFSGMSGSAMADAAGPGKLEVDAMVKTGYAPGFAWHCPLRRRLSGRSFRPRFRWSCMGQLRIPRSGICSWAV